MAQNCDIGQNYDMGKNDIGLRLIKICYNKFNDVTSYVTCISNEKKLLE